MQCQECQRALADNEPVYRVATGHSTNSYHRLKSSVGSLCKKCAGKVGGERQKWNPPEPCHNCGLSVVLNGRRNRHTLSAAPNAVKQSIIRCRADIERENHARHLLSAKLAASNLPPCAPIRGSAHQHAVNRHIESECVVSADCFL